MSTKTHIATVMELPLSGHQGDWLCFYFYVSGYFLCFVQLSVFMCEDYCLTCKKEAFLIFLTLMPACALWNLQIEQIKFFPSSPLSVSVALSHLHLLIHPLARTFGKGGGGNGSRPSLEIKALLVSWLTLRWTHTHTHSHSWQVLQLFVYCWV